MAGRLRGAGAGGDLAEGAASPPGWGGRAGEEQPQVLLHLLRLRAPGGGGDSAPAEPGAWDLCLPCQREPPFGALGYF